MMVLIGLPHWMLRGKMRPFSVFYDCIFVFSLKINYYFCELENQFFLSAR